MQFQNDTKLRASFIEGVINLAEQLVRFRDKDSFSRPHVGIKIRVHDNQFKNKLIEKVNRNKNKVKDYEIEIQSLKEENKKLENQLATALDPAEQNKLDSINLGRFKLLDEAYERQENGEKMEQAAIADILKVRQDAMLELTECQYEIQTLKRKLDKKSELLSQSYHHTRTMCSDNEKHIISLKSQFCTECVKLSEQIRQNIWVSFENRHYNFLPETFSDDDEEEPRDPNYRIRSNLSAIIKGPRILTEELTNNTDTTGYEEISLWDIARDLQPKQKFHESVRDDRIFEE